MPQNNTNRQNELNKNELNNILKNTKVQRPFMMFPLRLETHFRNVKGKKQLCVRVFPDEIMLDYHTDSLTKQEIEDGKFFWIQWSIMVLSLALNLVRKLLSTSMLSCLVLLSLVLSSWL